MAEITIIVHPQWDLTEKVVVGELTIEEIMKELERFYGRPITKRVLWDLSQAAFASIRSEDVADMSSAVAPLIKPRSGGKTAVVSTSDLGYGFSRMYQAYREVHQIDLPYMSFKTRQEAIDWLLSDVI